MPVAQAVRRLADLMIANPQIAEIDINPFIARPANEGGMALDALFVMADPDAT
jgi:hypothetical protein